MDKLPPELLHKIFIQLDLNQRLECLTVCRSWWSVLDRYSLFYDLSLKEPDNRFNTFMDKLKQLPNRANQIKKLQIGFRNDASFNRRELFNIFPNARLITVKQDCGSWDSTLNQFKGKLDITHSNAKVQHVEDFGYYKLASQLLCSNLGGQLETLVLDFRGVSGKPTPISQLKNLPVLKKLTLKSAEITLHDIEKIHKNVPSIQDLKLHFLRLTTGNMPANIKAATSITKFDLYACKFDSAKIHAQFYKYMTRKYTSATDFKYADGELIGYDESDRKYIYLNGVLDFFKVIDWSQNRLTPYGLPDNVDVFEVLDSSDAQIKDVLLLSCQSGTIFKYLFQSNQSKYIEKLDILNSSIDSIHFVKAMTALTTLQINFYDPNFSPINLATCLHACPPSLKLSSIENLHSGYITLTSGLGDIISSCFPKLLELDLTCEVTEDTTIVLKNPLFQKAKFSTSGVCARNNRTHCFSFLWPNQTEPLHYINQFTPKIRGFRKKKFVPYEYVQNFPALTVISFTEKKLETDDEIEVVPC